MTEAETERNDTLQRIREINEAMLCDDATDEERRQLRIHLALAVKQLTYLDNRLETEKRRRQIKVSDRKAIEAGIYKDMMQLKLLRKRKRGQ
jgi:hypothetical protein